MHLSFITSISVQKTFPPNYSLLPGTPLGYPFLCDSVSSTFYTLGASLRIAAMLPALYAFLVVVLGVYCFFDEWFKNTRVFCAATYLFFIGGGLGFAYLFNNKQLLAGEGINRWQEMLEGFYTTTIAEQTNSPRLRTASFSCFSETPLISIFPRAATKRNAEIIPIARKLCV